MKKILLFPGKLCYFWLGEVLVFSLGLYVLFLLQAHQVPLTSPEIMDISSPLTIISGISYYTPEQ